MTTTARAAADDSGPIEAPPKRRATDQSPPKPGGETVRGWLVFAVAVLGIVCGGVGSVARESYGSGERSAQIGALSATLAEHAEALKAHAALASTVAVRLAVVEVNVVAVKEGVGRIEQAMRDERAERRSGGGK